MLSKPPFSAYVYTILDDSTRNQLPSQNLTKHYYSLVVVNYSIVFYRNG